jgi:hypothetical protein
LVSSKSQRYLYVTAIYAFSICPEGRLEVCGNTKHKSKSVLNEFEYWQRTDYELTININKVQVLIPRLVLALMDRTDGCPES